jgi:hypothetical protein
MLGLARIAVRRISGFATLEGTAAFAARSEAVASNWNKTTTDLTVSSLGIGTYIGDLKDETDTLMTDAIMRSVSSGFVNMIDTAINYRY